MFLGVEYFLEDRPVRVAIDRRDGRVPVATRGGGWVMMLVGQGERFVDESPGQFQGWPEGSTVGLEMLRSPSGLWQKWRAHTTPVKIAVTRYFYADALGFRRQHDLASGQFLQGALLSKKVFERVYFVVVPAPNSNPEDNKWLPRIVGNAKKRS